MEHPKKASLMKRLRIMHAERLDWKRERSKYVMVYRSMERATVQLVKISTEEAGGTSNMTLTSHEWPVRTPCYVAVILWSSSSTEVIVATTYGEDLASHHVLTPHLPGHNHI